MATLAGILIVLIFAAAFFYLVRKFLIVCAVLARPTINQRTRYRRAVDSSLHRQAEQIQHEHHPSVVDPLYYYPGDEDENEEDEF